MANGDGIKQVGSIDIDSFWLPKALSTGASDVDVGFHFVTWSSIVIFIGVIAVMTAAVLKFRRKHPGEMPPRTGHNTPLEITWTVLPLVLVMGFFLVGFKGFLNASIVPAGAYEIQVQGAKWLWAFTYPNGVTTTDELRVPAGKDVRLVISSKDVVHSVWIPAFRVKTDAVPGSYTSVWFNATEPTETVLECTEYCGTSHSNMLAKVIVMPPDEFEEWLESEGEPADMPPAELGERLFTKNACNTCHSVDGSRLTGPTVKGLFGSTEQTNVGPVQVDENYLRESILNPSAKIVTGYPPVMPTFKGILNDKQVDALIAYMKSLQ